MVRMIKRNIFDFFFIFTIFLIDRISKIIIINQNSLNENINYPVTSFLNFHLIWNEGIAFGLLSFDEKNYYNLLTVIIVSVTLIIFYFIVKSNGLQKYGFMMIFSGSLGNIFDRLYYASVPDFIDFHINNFHWFIFNVADIFITLGIIFLICIEIFNNKKIKNEDY